MIRIYLISIFLITSIFSNAQDLKDSLTIYFNFNEYVLKEVESQKLISFTQSICDENKTIKSISIEAHCDSIGSINYNQNLSLNRCKTVNKIINNYCPNVVCKLSPKGKSIFVSDNKTENGRALNRRAKIIIKYNLKNISSDTLVEKKVEKITKGNINGVKIEKGKNIVIKNMNFVGGQHTLVSSGRFAAQRLLQTMVDNPTLKIEIQGHICCSKPNEDGLDFATNELKLSENRAKAIYDYLVENGIDSTRMTYIGMKGDFPLVTPEITEADKNANRRVEVKILDY